jgi:hypothetical protein
MTWLQEWWVQSQLDRRAMLYPYEGSQELVPAYPWLPDGTPSTLEGQPFPLSFVAAVVRRLPTLINLDQLRRSVFAALAGKPDIRTPYQRSRDDWQAYLKAKEKYLGKKEEDPDELIASKKRDQKRKGQKLKRAAHQRQLMRGLRANRTFANIVAIRDQPPLKRGETEREPGQSVFGVRTGLFGHPTTTVLRVQDEKVVGAVEDVRELAEIATQVGLLTLGALLKYNLAGGPEGLAKALALWCGIDLEKLAREAEAADLEKVKADIEAQRAVELQQATEAALDNETAEPTAIADMGGEG